MPETPRSAPFRFYSASACRCGLYAPGRSPPFPPGAICIDHPDATVLVEHDGLVAVNEHTAFEVPADGLREDELLEIAASADQVLDAVAVRHARNVLMNDWAFVQIPRRVMRGR